MALPTPYHGNDMKTASFKALCTKVLVPEMDRLLRRRAASPTTIADLTEVIARHFVGVSDNLDVELFRIHEKLDKVISLLENQDSLS